MDGDGDVGAFDVDDFSTALAALPSTSTWDTAHPGLDIDIQGDCDQNGVFDAFDTNPFGDIVADTYRYVTEAASR